MQNPPTLDSQETQPTLLSHSHMKPNRQIIKLPTGVLGISKKLNLPNQEMVSTHIQTTTSNALSLTHVSPPVPRPTPQKTAAQDPTTTLKSASPTCMPNRPKPSVQMPTPTLLTTKLPRSSSPLVVAGKSASVLQAEVQTSWLRSKSSYRLSARRAR